MLKLNVGCGCNYICAQKNQTNERLVLAEMKRWIKKKPWLGYAEMQYKGVEKKILVEKYLAGQNGGAPEDYKIYCFDGQPLAILYMSGRFSGKLRVGFFDRDWNYLGNEKAAYEALDESDLPERPQSLSTMLTAAEKLSAGFPFVRVDFFEVDQKAVFGEMTFTPAAGFDVSEVEINGRSMAEYLSV